MLYNNLKKGGAKTPPNFMMSDFDRYIRSMKETPAYDIYNPELVLLRMLGKSREEIIINSPFYYTPTLTRVGGVYGRVFQLCKN